MPRNPDGSFRARDRFGRAKLMAAETRDLLVEELSLPVPMPVEERLLPIHEDMLEVAQLFDDAARQLRRLGSGAIKNGPDLISSRHIYKFANKVRIVDSFQRDVCFEIANRLE